MILKVASTSEFFDFPKSSQLDKTQEVSVRNFLEGWGRGVGGEEKENLEISGVKI